METTDVEQAVRRVLPALNLRPDQFRLDRGFLARAKRSSAPRAVALNGIAELFVFMGLRAAADPEAAVLNVATDALASLSSTSRTVCQRLVVGWADPDGRVFAAAFVVSSDGAAVGRLLASSWSAPDSWPEPMIDASKTGEEALNDALALLESTVSNRLNLPGSTFDSRLARAVRLVDVALLHVGGEGQSISARPSEGASDDSWCTWLDRYKRSVHDEWNRVSGNRINTLNVINTGTDGPLAGQRIFLSYARPDATSLAWPVYEALRSCGATVWFDQENPTDERQLAVGLAETIGSCDAYIMCASDEFIERAGYATQEFAWATQHRESGVKPTHFLVVAQPDTILPSAVAAWPTIEMPDDGLKTLAHRLITHLKGPPLGLTAQPADTLLKSPAVASLLPLPPEANIPTLLSRAEHARLFDKISQEAIVRALSGEQDDQQATEVRRRLLSLGDGLAWTGTLEDLDSWPNDAFIRDIRFRFASERALIGTRWPLNGDLNWKPGVADDVQYLATYRVPSSDWPAVVGWDDYERRLALRHHAGVLRLLQDLIGRGLTSGLLHVSSSTVVGWGKELSTRRRECHDALLALRLEGRLSWQKDPPTWDRLFQSWSELITTANGLWLNPVPFEVLQLLVGNAIESAAVGAEIAWYVSRYGGLASQSFLARGIDFSARIEVYAIASGVRDIGNTAESENRIRLGLVAGAESNAEVRLSWKGTRFAGCSRGGESSKPAADQLCRAVNFFRS